MTACKLRIFHPILFYLLFINAKCEETTGKSKIIFPSFRIKIEEMEEPAIKTDKIDAHSNLVAVLVKNVKEIFNDLSDTESTDLDAVASLGLDFRPTIKANNEDNFSIRPSVPNDATVFDNLSLPALSDKRGGQKAPMEHVDENKGKNELLHLTKDLMYHEKVCNKEVDVRLAGDDDGLNITQTENDATESRRSCIFCDNVRIEDCHDPKNKLIPSIMCEREEDLCYSQHTPFGIIDRGCFNVNHNLTTYVCSCNLCNYIPISEMPYIFSNKRDWVDNVVELSRTRHFRKSVFKDMTCLRCEVNVTNKRGDMLDSANCLEGNVGALPAQQCYEDEICAVKAIKNTGYVWRGCVKSPLYNYWWALCDTDLCNYDALISIYDYM